MLSLGLASMGPWLCSHGNKTPAVHARSDSVASMGPWLCSHGNQMVPVVMRYGVAVLQWGRGCVATEIFSAERAPRNAVTASMGPWLCSHGNAVYAERDRQAAMRFNGAVAV